MREQWKLGMQPSSLRRRWFPEAALSATSAVLAVVTLFWKDWIEVLFRADPDGGSAALEWSVVAGLLVLAVALGALAHYELTRASPRPA